MVNLALSDPLENTPTPNQDPPSWGSIVSWELLDAEPVKRPAFGSMRRSLQYGSCAFRQLLAAQHGREEVGWVCLPLPYPPKKVPGLKQTPSLFEPYLSVRYAVWPTRTVKGSEAFEWVSAGI